MSTPLLSGGGALGTPDGATRYPLFLIHCSPAKRMPTAQSGRPPLTDAWTPVCVCGGVLFKLVNYTIAVRFTNVELCAIDKAAAVTIPHLLLVTATNILL